MAPGRAEGAPLPGYPSTGAGVHSTPEAAGAAEHPSSSRARMHFEPQSVGGMAASEAEDAELQRALRESLALAERAAPPAVTAVPAGMSEEEQLEWAMRESVQQQPSPPPQPPPPQPPPPQPPQPSQPSQPQPQPQPQLQPQPQPQPPQPPQPQPPQPQPQLQPQPQPQPSPPDSNYTLVSSPQEGETASSTASSAPPSTTWSALPESDSPGGRHLMVGNHLVGGRGGGEVPTYNDVEDSKELGI